MMEKLKNSKYTKWIIAVGIVLIFVFREVIINGIIKGGLLKFKKAQNESNEIDKSIAEKSGRVNELNDINNKLDNDINNIKDDENWNKKR